ncbi:hypothetical protein MPL1032_20516 [Mesorhizobium plurifarium]|uniref:Uncharacterized protein n=1 Tax=Mesorhizobium plurifarium TaxID=69974 RepID=A0A0K2VX92_MESPL|nr:hypothetical protein MPL1032_20516 [Mesorhizobium plurifarium]
MVPATADVAPLPWRDHLAALVALRRGVAVQFSVDAADGIRALRVLFSLGQPSGDMLAALDRFERAIVECDDPSTIELRRRNCLVILDRLAAEGLPRAS